VRIECLSAIYIQVQNYELNDIHISFYRRYVYLINIFNFFPTRFIFVRFYFYATFLTHSFQNNNFFYATSFYAEHIYRVKRKLDVKWGVPRLPTLRLTAATHSSWCPETFHCSSAVAGGW